MYTVIIEETFDAVHSVRMPDGVFEEPHCHNWMVQAAVHARELDENGFAIEFLYFKRLLKNILSALKDKNLNDLDCFQLNIPTAEAVCKYVYDNLKKSLPSGVYIEYTLVQEAKGCYVKYTQ